MQHQQHTDIVLGINCSYFTLMLIQCLIFSTNKNSFYSFDKYKHCMYVEKSTVSKEKKKIYIRK